MIEMSSIQLDTSYKACYEIMKEKAVNFYHAFKFMDQNRFKAITGVYAFCRYVDDIVDENEEESLDKKLKKLSEIEGVISSIELEHTDFSKNHIWFYAFKKAVLDFDISKDSLLDQIKGQRNDLNFSGIDSMDDLVHYSTLVAGSVGRMLLPMLSEHRHAKALDICNRLGVAMQITNILRDIGEDYRERSRIYIPRDTMRQFSITQDTLGNLSDMKSKDIPGDSTILLWESLAHKAESEYNYFIDNIQIFHDDARMPLLLACENYRAIIGVIRNENYNCFRKRCYTSKMKRVEILHNVKKMMKSVEMR